MANLDNSFLIPLKVVNARCEHLKINLKGLFKNIERRAIQNIRDKNKVDAIATWDDWIYAALDSYSPGWAKKLVVGEAIPQNLLDQLPCPTGELISLGSWLLTKNIYRFDDDVAKELIKSDFKGK